MTKLEETRATELLEAQAKAERLFTEIETRGLIRPAITEKTLNADIYALAKEMYGITTYWHKRIVRSGPNTVCIFAENPPVAKLPLATRFFSISVRSSTDGKPTSAAPM